MYLFFNKNKAKTSYSGRSVSSVFQKAECFQIVNLPTVFAGS